MPAETGEAVLLGLGCALPPTFCSSLFVFAQNHRKPRDWQTRYSLFTPINLGEVLHDWI